MTLTLNPADYDLATLIRKEQNMTQKDFVLIAQVLSTHRQTILADADESIEDETQDRLAETSWIAGEFADALAGTNPRFDRQRFLAACGVPS